MTCRVFGCTALAEAAIDLDPGKPGGQFSYSYETPLCSDHITELSSPATSWMIDNFDGQGPAVLVGNDLAELNEWALTRAVSVSSGSMSRRSSVNVPRRMTIALKLAKTGTDETREVSFAATPEELRELIDFLEDRAAPR